MKRSLLVGALLAATLPGALAAEPTGAMLGNTCSGCHGTLGVSAGLAMPTLAGMPAEFIALAMREFRDGTRSSTIMGRIAKGFSDPDIDAMAAYFEAQKWISAAQGFDGKLAAAGKRVHDRKCEACHRDGGASTEQDMPRMAGQWRDYLQITFDACRDPKRTYHQSPPMKQVLERLSDKDIQALTHYYASKK
jgi:sulfide dehydrogenase cytochrome subunit